MRKILVANRGEIALRVIKTCRELGIVTVAVYSEIDCDALHVRAADEAYLIGPAPATESYLRMDKILEIGKTCGADAIHPGYGFLSENDEFVDLVERQGLTFIGPSADSIRLLGDKTEARKLAMSLGVPIVPGMTSPVRSKEEALSIATQMGYPVLLKAVAGGGGKGMRIVQNKQELPSALQASRSEARSSFGDDRVYIEKYIEDPRHVEVQIVADSHGHVVHLGERECSIQRRHQKIVEESPSPIVDDALRADLFRAAMELVRRSGYVNAGTVEFMVDRNQRFYFLEVNTRLQVEHPVTEMRTGVDLVREQINIAEGNSLTFRQSDISFAGHSIECRIYAEDPRDNFCPSTGLIEYMKTPKGFGIREDGGVEIGSLITPYYDPLISKLIVWGATRNAAVDRMAAALNEYEIYGVRNNLELCSWIMGDANFRSGDFDTNFMAKRLSDMIRDAPAEIVLASITSAVKRDQVLAMHPPSSPSGAIRSRWREQLSQEF